MKNPRINRIIGYIVMMIGFVLFYLSALWTTYWIISALADSAMKTELYNPPA